MLKDKLKLIIGTVIAVSLVVIASIQYSEYKERKEEERFEELMYIKLDTMRKIRDIIKSNHTELEKNVMIKKLYIDYYKIPEFKKEIDKGKNDEEKFKIFINSIKY